MTSASASTATSNTISVRPLPPSPIPSTPLGSCTGSGTGRLLTDSNQPMAAKTPLTDQQVAFFNGLPPPPPPPLKSNFVTGINGNMPSVGSGLTPLSIPSIRPPGVNVASAATGGNGGGPMRRRVSDKTALPISTGMPILMAGCVWKLTYRNILCAS